MPNSMPNIGARFPSSVSDGIPLAPVAGVASLGRRSGRLTTILPPDGAIICGPVRHVRTSRALCVAEFHARVPLWSDYSYSCETDGVAPPSLADRVLLRSPELDLALSLPFEGRMWNAWRHDAPWAATGAALRCGVLGSWVGPCPAGLRTTTFRGARPAAAADPAQEGRSGSSKERRTEGPRDRPGMGACTLRGLSPKSGRLWASRSACSPATRTTESRKGLGQPRPVGRGPAPCEVTPRDLGDRLDLQSRRSSAAIGRPPDLPGADT
jgi:hypothetical protein